MTDHRGSIGTRLQREQGNDDQRNIMEVFPNSNGQPEQVTLPVVDNLTAQALPRSLQFMQQQGTGIPRAVGLDMSDRALERFLRFNPPEFHGAMNDVEADRWLDQVEHILTVLGCAKEKSVNYGVYLLEGAACN